MGFDAKDLYEMIRSMDKENRADHAAIHDKLSKMEVVLAKLDTAINGDGNDGFAARLRNVEQEMDELKKDLNAKIDGLRWSVIKIFIAGVAIGVGALLLSGKVSMVLHHALTW